MAWLPDLPGLLYTIKDIESGENLVHNSFRLFWMFCDSSLNPEEFDKRLSVLRDQLARPDPAGHYEDPEIDDFVHRALEDPDTAVKAVVARLEALCETKRVTHRIEQPEDATSLYISLHLEAARLLRLLNTQGFSIDSRAALERTLETHALCEKAIGDYRNAPWPEIYSPSLRAIGSFLDIRRFHVQKYDGAYEEALVSVAKGIETFQQVRILLFPKRGKWASTYQEVILYTVNNKLQQSAAWMENLDPQAIVDCFEAVREGKRIKNRQLLASTCQRLLNLCSETPWLKPKEEDGIWDGLNRQWQQPFTSQPINWNAPWQKPNQIKEVRDADGAYWEPTLFWQRANWWAESQLQESELLNLIEEREVRAAEKRLKEYFFGDQLWTILSERARGSLINADRDWFGGANARTEALLNELKVAAEEVLLRGLWLPLDQWATSQGSKYCSIAEFTKLKTELTDKGFAPDLLHHEQVCRMTVTGTFLKKKGIPVAERQWFLQELPKSLRRLRNARRGAEHGTGRDWTRPQLRQFIAEFLGIGQPGLLPRATDILFRQRK